MNQVFSQKIKNLFIKHKNIQYAPWFPFNGASKKSKQLKNIPRNIYNFKNYINRSSKD